MIMREVDYTGDDWKSLAEDGEVWRAYVHAAMKPTGSLVPVS